MGKLTDSYNLKKINPKLAKEWHPTKNGKLTPMDVTPSSARKVWWICEKNHEWEASINNRTMGTKCPYCAGKAVCEDTTTKVTTGGVIFGETGSRVSSLTEEKHS